MTEQDEVRQRACGLIQTGRVLALEEAGLVIVDRVQQGYRERELQQYREDRDLIRRDMGRLGEALGHPDVARPVSSATLMAQWTGEVRTMADALRAIVALLTVPYPIGNLQSELVNMYTQAELARRRAKAALGEGSEP